MMYINRSLRLLPLFTAIAGLAFATAPKATAQAAAVPNDQEIVNQAPSYSLDKLVELIGIYDRLGKRQVTQALADEILKRDPKNASALAVKEGRPVAPKTDDGPGSAQTPEDLLANQIESLQRRHGFGELISLLNNSKKGYAGKAFPFQDDLADAYYESGKISAAKSAYREMANSSKYTSTQRSTARKTLRDIENMERIANAHQLSLAGNHGEALAIVEDLKSKHSGGSFPYESDLGDVLFASGDLDGAETSYSKVANSSGYDSKQRADARAGLRDVAKGRKLLEANALIKRKRLDEAMLIADELEAGGWKNDEDVHMLRASVMIEQGRLGEAIDLLSRIKEKSYKNKPFPGQTDLASAYYRANRLREAQAGYVEIVDGKYLPLEQEEAGIELRDIDREVNGMLSLDIGYVTEDEGDSLLSALTVRSPLYNDNLRIWAFARRDDFKLSNERSLIADSGERFEGGFAIEKFIDSTLSVAGYVGGSESDGGDSDQFLFGGSFTKRVGRGKVGMEFAYNERAIDSISLQVLDGRQHRVQLNVDMPLGNRWNVDGFVYYRQIEALGDKIGDGFGAQLDLLYTVREANKRRPGVRVGYAGEYHKFNDNKLDGRTFGPYLKGGAAAATDLALDLVEEEINFHSLKVVVEGRLNKYFSYYVSGAVGYDFFDREIQYSVGTGVEVQMSDRWRFIAGVEYYSAGQTTSSLAGVVLGTAGFSYTF
jgi:hypothetical protein